MKVADLKFCYTTALNFKLVQVGAKNILFYKAWWILHVPYCFFCFYLKFVLLSVTKARQILRTPAILLKSIGICKLFKFEQEQKQAKPDFCLNISTICTKTNFVCNMKGVA